MTVTFMTVTTAVSTSRWRAIAFGQAVMLIGLIVWDGADRRASDATRQLPQGTSAAVKQNPPQTLKLASFNIHGGKGTDGVLNLPRIAKIIGDHDFIGLYEVRSAIGNTSANQAATLAGYCQAGWTFAPSEQQWWSDHFGNGLIYRIPVNCRFRLPLVNTRGKAYRNAVLSIVELQDKSVRVLSVHVDRERDRTLQLKTVIDLFLNLEKPCVLMGDLNTTADDSLLTSLMDQPEVQSPLHEQLAGELPSQNIDWIFTRGLKTISANLFENDGSDHPLVSADLIPAD
jgi:endonuclease/exonuclease/phosphatase family metal-dependent hydrolase